MEYSKKNRKRRDDGPVRRKRKLDDRSVDSLPFVSSRWPNVDLTPTSRARGRRRIEHSSSGDESAAPKPLTEENCCTEEIHISKATRKERRAQNKRAKKIDAALWSAEWRRRTEMEKEMERDPNYLQSILPSMTSQEEKLACMRQIETLRIPPDEERFVSRTQRDNECVMSTGAVDKTVDARRRECAHTQWLESCGSRETIKKEIVKILEGFKKTCPDEGWTWRLDFPHTRLGFVADVHIRTPFVSFAMVVKIDGELVDRDVIRIQEDVAENEKILIEARYHLLRIPVGTKIESSDELTKLLSTFLDHCKRIETVGGAPCFFAVASSDGTTYEGRYSRVRNSTNTNVTTPEQLWVHRLSRLCN